MCRTQMPRFRRKNHQIASHLKRNFVSHKIQNSHSEYFSKNNYEAVRVNQRHSLHQRHRDIKALPNGLISTGMDCRLFIPKKLDGLSAI